MNWGSARTVVLEHNAAQQLDAACTTHHRADEAWNSLEWLLARNPGIGVSRTETVSGIKFTLYAQASDAIAKTPRIVILFTSDEDHVQVFDMRFDAYEPAPAITT